MGESKKILVGILCIALLACSCFFCTTGCNNQDKQPESHTFYSLEEAFNNGWLLKNDLITIADYHNNGKSYSENLNESVEYSIKEQAAEILRSDSANALDEAERVNAEDFKISKYYGTYNGFAIVSVECNLFHYTAESNPITIEIGGVAFNFGHPRYMKQMVAWKI